MTRLFPVSTELDLSFEEGLLSKGCRQRLEQANLEAFGVEGAGRGKDEPE